MPSSQPKPLPEHNLECAKCGRPFTFSGYASRKCCSAACLHVLRVEVGRHRAAKLGFGKNQPKKLRTCRHCGEQFHKTSGGEGIFCSKKCYGAHRTATAETQKAAKKTAREVELAKQRGLQKELAKAQAEALRRRLSEANCDRTCRICGASFRKPLFRPGIFRVCPNCKGEQALRTRRKCRQSTGKKPCERARKRGLPYERCGPISVCTRDRWHCQICGCSTPRRLRGTFDPRAPEIDHIVPLSHPNSPGHVWSNVQCACRRCNIAKGAKVQGQLRLAV